MPVSLQLSDYDVDPITGFLPTPDPLLALPPAYAAWDALGAQLPGLLLAGQLRAAVAKLPLLDPAQLVNTAEWERAMLLLSTAANAFVWATPEPALRLPACLAIPLWQVTEHLGRKPIIGHASNVLHNWRRLDPHGPIALENLSTIQPFLGSSDEAWFVLVTVAIEACGAPVLAELVQAQAAVRQADLAALDTALIQIADRIVHMSATLLRMYEHCEPFIFYRRVRPFLASWPAPGVIYAGVSETPLVFAGGSAGQSSLVQSLDAALGVRHQSERSRPFLAEMRDYMPPAHRRFVEALEQGPDLHVFVADQQATAPALVGSYNTCIARLTEFRKIHMEIAVRYISMQAATPDAAKGTGGTSLTHFLGAAKRETRDHQIG